MPLPVSVPREELHFRHIQLRGFRRVDGLYDVEARLVDTKTEEITVGAGRVVSPGKSIHDMSVRLVVDEDLNVRDAMASTDASPHGICREATSTLQCLKGLCIGAGWSKAINERLAGHKGCTHLTELLKPLATVAFQTLWTVRNSQPDAVDPSGKPRKIDSCFAYASDRELVRERWPAYYMGIDGN
ncbi:DUF2889 domain-containing protein [Noviherbaspirillum sedimenti]|uniref:DUF2889 domain-containing protein n=1 Tax=Noviherbaspirillum sedimenti TaxID=2320865 RepID=A0A3A3G999_9BURK|nr:DUF2889 domain-containing protein [Noviherbaspirillum sedimenti]RJG03319.1 DUF2889 domain-containing protein [Noviherbaspirillum sedimenti]